MDPDGEDALESRLERQRRRTMLAHPHMISLTQYVEELDTKSGGRRVPYFDPLDGGVEARVLIA